MRTKNRLVALPPNLASTALQSTRGLSATVADGVRIIKKMTTKDVKKIEIESGVVLKKHTISQPRDIYKLVDRLSYQHRLTKQDLCAKALYVAMHNSVVMHDRD